MQGMFIDHLESLVSERVCLSVCMCVCIHVFVYMYACTCTCMCVHVCVYVYVYRCMCVCTCMCVYVCVYMYMYLYMYIFVHVSMYVTFNPHDIVILLITGVQLLVIIIVVMFTLYKSASQIGSFRITNICTYSLMTLKYIVYNTKHIHVHICTLCNVHVRIY